MSSEKPKVSGVFAAVIGIACLAGAVEAHALSQVCPSSVLALWLVLSGLILLGWGINRTVSSSTMIAGQPTIAMVTTVLGVTFAIWALALPKDAEASCHRTEGSSTLIARSK